MHPLIRADRLSVHIGSTRILRDVAFEIPEGSLVGLLGPNGSGKTTLLRTVAGLLPYDGLLDLAGRPVGAWPPRQLARKLAFVRQIPTLSFEFAVEELVLLGRSPHKRLFDPYTPSDYNHARRVLAAVDLEGFEKRSVLTLSGGELQRVLLAQALVQESEVLLLDEPTAHLDVHYQFDLLERVRTLVQQGRTCMAVFHDLEFAARFADFLMVLKNGQVVATGRPEAVLSEDLIRSVFRMQARVHTDADRLRISYVQPVSDGPVTPDRP